MKEIRLNRYYTDILKIFAAFCVVIGHYASITIVNDWSQSKIWYIIASQAGYIGVALFFFLSGYGLMESEQKQHLVFKEFVKRRFFKIYKPVLLVTVIWVLFEILCLNKSLSVKVIYDCLWGFDDCVLWFIKILMGLYLSFYAFSLLRIRNHERYGLWVLAAGTVLLMIVAHYTEGYSSIGIPCFAIGVLTSLKKDKRIIGSTLVIVFIVSVLYSILTHDNHGYHAAFDYILILMTVLIPLAFNNPAKGRCSKILKDVISYGSLLTFDVYLVHYKILDGATRLNGGGILDR